MTLMDLAKRFEKLAADNSPAILTAIGVTGTITTAVLTGRASYKAAQIIEEMRNEEPDRYVEPRECAEETWKLYIPAVVTAGLTVACIIGANRIGTRRAAAMATAYSLSEKAFTEYREKIIQKLGETKEQKARDELAQERVNENPVGNREIIVAGGGDVLCYEEFTDRYFLSSMEALKKAQNDTNHQVNNHYYASLTDFYHNVGLKPTAYSDEVGWNSDELLELRFSTTLSEDGRPCISIGYNVKPIRDYHRVH